MKAMKPDLRPLVILLAVMCCMAAFCFPAFAVSHDYYTSDETGMTTVPDAIESIRILSEDVDIFRDFNWEENAVELDEDQFFDLLAALFSGDWDGWDFDYGNWTDWADQPYTEDNAAFTPDGNLTLVDDFFQDETEYTDSDRLERKDKQFITVQTKAGNYFYIVIDRSGDSENVYFLNMVDDSDLFALLEDEAPAEEIAPAVCICEDKCAVGAVNTDCPVCAVDLNACVGKEPEVVEEPEPEPETEVEAEEPEATTEGKKESSKKGFVFVILAVVAAACGAVYYLKIRKKPVNTSGPDDLDDYYDGYEDEEIDLEDEEEPDEEAGK